MLTTKLGSDILKLQRKLGKKEAAFMNKEEILRKSREDYSEKDGMLKEHQKSNRPIFAAVLLAAAFLIWLDAKYIEGSFVSESVFIMIWAMVSADCFYSFYLSKINLKSFQ